MKKTVSKTFRKIVFREYSHLKDDLRYQRHFRRLLFTTLREDGKPIAGQQQLAQDEGKEHLLASKNYSAIAFMEEVQQVMDPASYQWSGYSYTDKRCRILTVKFSKVVQDALEKELQGHWARDERVYFVGGRKFNPRARGEALKTARDRAANSLGQNDCEAAKRIQTYMNGVPPHRFTKTLG